MIALHPRRGAKERQFMTTFETIYVIFLALGFAVALASFLSKK
jgi:hypothetical protein